MRSVVFIDQQNEVYTLFQSPKVKLEQTKTLLYFTVNIVFSDMGLHSGILLLTLLVALGACRAGELKSVVIETPSGPVRGYREDLNENFYVHRFIKIPYAEPPVGNLRFRKPNPIGKWSEVQGVPEKYGPACMQQDLGLELEFKPENSEDCLHVNVYVPGEVARGRRLAVMVYIYGGGFVFGCAGEYRGQRLAAHGDVIVVTFNYRLGLFGFLNLLDPVAKGNYGLWDQMMAIRWVHENIEAFGGNPDSITIFGESAGGMSVHYQTLFPGNEGMFQKAISMSGVVNRQVVTKDENIKKVIKKITESTECKMEDKAELFDCLQNLPPADVVAAVNVYDMMAPDNFTLEMLLGPSIDGELVTSKLYDTMHDRNAPESRFFRSVDFMAGTTNAEGSLLYFSILPDFEAALNFSHQDGIPQRVLCEAIIPGIIQDLYGSRPDLSEALCQFYSSDEGNEVQSNQAADFYGDSVMVAPTVSALLAHSRDNAGRRTYSYLVSAPSPLPFGPPAPPWFKGCGHADELYLLFDMPDLPIQNLTEARHEQLSSRIIRYFTNFAKTG